jgi:uncharacterized protein
VSQENVEIVRRAFGALASGRVDAAAEFWHPDINWRAVEGAPDDVGEMRGIEAARAYVQDWYDTFDDFTAEPEELIAVGDDQVVAVIHNAGRAKRSGIPSELRYAAVYTLRDGRLVRVREYETRAEALKTVGLEE